MKHIFRKRILPLLLAVCTVLSVGAALTFPVAAASEISVQNGTGSDTAMSATDNLGYRAIVQGEFTGFSFHTPTWATSESDCTLALYKWAGSPAEITL